MPKRPLLAVLAVLAIAGCHREPKSVAGLNPDDAAALNNAADMLDTSADDLTAPASGALNADANDADDNGVENGE